jgi:hypothetical protein
MDVRFFLVRRLAFIEQLYTNSAAPFIERKRKIEVEEEPFVPPYSEDGGEPAFLSEWLDADESLKVLGCSCISMLAGAFHLYFKTWERQIGIPVDASLKPTFKKAGWFNGYKAYFARNLSISFEDSSCDLALLEELVLARNRAQHPDSLASHSSHYSDDDLKKIRRPFFVDDRERELLIDAEEVEPNWLLPPTIHITPERMLAALSEVARFANWLERVEFEPDRRSL